MEEIKKVGGQVKDLSGQVFGRLTVVELDGFTKHRLSKWLCRCSCGNEKVVISGNLKYGTTTSCGCYNKEQQLVHSLTHGMTNTPEWYSWQDLRKRCKGSNDKAQRDYVDRGITVHPDFSESFEKFYAHIGPKPSEDTWMVGRIDNSLGYTYGNVQWETPAQQSRNKTRYTSNKTGVAGVSFNGKAYVAQTRQLDGKSKTKTFSVSIYGKDEAFLLAVKAREQMIKELNEQGAGYAPEHGCDK